jgi:hypothetical protein
MGIGDFFDYETRIRKAVDDGIDANLKKIPALVDDSLGKLETRTQRVFDVSLDKLDQRTNSLLDRAQERLRAASATFFSDLEQRWEKRLENETRAQFKLLNRVLLYTIAVAVISFAYAVARTKLGW